MGDPQMALLEQDVRRIGEYVKPWIAETVRAALREMVPERSLGIDIPLLERMVRVEEELKSQRELMTVRFEAMDRRFEDQRTSIDQRFDETRARDRRSDWFMGVGFTIVTVAVTLVGVLL